MKVLWTRHFMVTPLMYCNQLQLSTSKLCWHTPFCQRYYHFHHFTQSQNLRVISDSSFLFSYLISQHSCLRFLQKVVHVHFIPLPHRTLGSQHIMPKLFQCFHWSFPSPVFNHSLIPLRINIQHALPAMLGRVQLACLNLTLAVKQIVPSIVLNLSCMFCSKGEIRSLNGTSSGNSLVLPLKYGEKCSLQPCYSKWQLLTMTHLT